MIPQRLATIENPGCVAVAPLRTLYERGYMRNEMLALLGLIDNILGLPEDLEDRLRQTLRGREAQWNTTPPLNLPLRKEETLAPSPLRRHCCCIHSPL
jgi:hypothetical protein